MSILSDARAIRAADSDVSISAAVRMAANLPRGVDVDDCDFYLVYGETVIVMPGFWADDGQCAVEFRYADSGLEAANEYVSGGEWGEKGAAIDVCTWREALDSNGASLRVCEESHTIDVEPDHASLIADAMRGQDSCGDDPEDHDWTREGEGGCSSNPGVWSLGGTRMSFAAHCRRCGLRRTVTDPGSQRNPGDCVEYIYESPDSDYKAVQ